MARYRYNGPVLIALLAGCGPSAPSAPPPPELTVIGTLAEAHVADPDREYVLVDGQRIHVSLASTRILSDGGLGQPFVLGRDAEGQFVAVFVAQDGLPGDCHLLGLDPQGTDRGPYIELAGVKWRKAATFRSTEAPAPGGTYAGPTRFCFNEQAEVAYTIP